MTCDDCTRSAAGSWHGFTASCVACRARGVARGPAFAESQALGSLTRDYRDQLTRLGLTHDQVKAAGAADAKGST